VRDTRRAKQLGGLILFVVLLIVVIVMWRWLQHPAPSDITSRSTPPSTAQESASVHIALTNVSNNALQGEAHFTTTISGLKDIRKVAYYVDGLFTGVTYTEPFNFTLDTTKLSNGIHTVTVKAYGVDRTVIESDPFTITVANQTTSNIEDNTSVSGTTSTSRVRGQKYTFPLLAQLALLVTGSTADHQAPSAPSNVILSADDGYTVQIQWSASTDNKGIKEYMVFRDGTQLGTSAGTSFIDQTVAPGNTYTYKIMAKDTADNTSSDSNEPSISLAPTTIWHRAESPAPGNFDNDPTPIELGVKFRPLVNGKITGVRFYKASGSTGTHVGHLWASDGTPLATANFSGETASGWQQVTFSTPVEVTANTSYVVSYFSPNGGYGYSSAYFASAGVTAQYLSALKSGIDGNNGLFKVGSTGFPTSSFDNTNYWVEPTFAPNKDTPGPTAKVADNSELFPGFPGSNNTGVPVGKRLPKRDRTIIVYDANATLDNIEVGSDISIRGNNVTVKNVRVAPQQALIWGITQITGTSGLTVEDTEIYGDGTHQLQYGIQDNGSDFTGRRIRIHTMTQAIQSNVNVLIEDSYFNGQIYFAGDHTGGYLNTGGHDVVLRHNNMRNPLNQTTSLGLMCDFAPITNVLAENNLLAGGGYAVYAPPCSGSGNIKFINNKFDRAIWPNGSFFGPVTSYDPAQPGNAWTNNTWLEDGTPVNP